MNQFGHGGEKALTRRLSEQSRCTRCLVRWRQSKLGLCRRCERELGIEAEGQLEREAERVQKAALKLRTGQSSYLHPHERRAHAERRRQPRPVTLPSGMGLPYLDYVVVWAGDMDGADAMGLPMGHEKRSSYRATEHWNGERRGGGLRHPGAFDGDALD